MIEEWRTCPLDGLSHYEVSNFGKVRLLPRDVPTHIVNRGRDMIVTAHRSGKDIKVQYDGGRPIVRMQDIYGKRRKLSLPLLVLRTFKMDECPEDTDTYTSAYIDGDITNNRLDNLVWVSKVALMSSLANTLKGEPHPYLVKYEYILIKINGFTVGYFENTTEGCELFNEYGIATSTTTIARALKENRLFYYVFELVPVSKEEYIKVSMSTPQMNLKVLYDIIMEDRRHFRKVPVAKEQPKKVKVKTVIKKEIVEKIVYKPKIVEKIVYKERPEKKKEVKKSPLPKKTDKLDSIDDSEFYKEQEKKKELFMKEMKSRLGM